MKSHGGVQMVAHKHLDYCRLVRGVRPAAKVRDVSHEEMQNLLCKLKNLVPNVPRNRKLSKLEIIQYVIDYILDLQNALETHPAASGPKQVAAAAAASSSPLVSSRQPLGVISLAVNSPASQMETDKTTESAAVACPMEPLPELSSTSTQAASSSSSDHIVQMQLD